MRSLLIPILILIAFKAHGEDLAARMQSMSAQIEQTKNPEKKARMQKQFDKRMTPKFEQHMRNAQNNMVRFLGRLDKHLKGGHSVFAQTELNTFQKHLARFEKLSQAAPKLKKFGSSQFGVKLLRAPPGGRTSHLFQVTPQMGSLLQKTGAPVGSHVRAFLSKANLLKNRRSNNSVVRSPPANAVGNQGRMGAPRNIEDINSFRASP